MEKQILKTLAFWQAFAGVPLTLQEIQHYFLEKSDSKTVSLFDIQKNVKTLVKRDLVVHKNGFYAIKKYQEILDTRILNGKNALERWKKLKKRGWFLPYIPYTNSIDITGSVAIGACKEKSDIDILTTAKQGHIWTVRFFNTIIAWILGVRGHKDKFKNRLCFCHYHTEGVKHLGPTNIDYVVKKVRTNVWSTDNDSCYENIFCYKPLGLSIGIKTGLEKALDFTKISALMEKVLGWIQITNNKRSKEKYPGKLEPLTYKVSNIIFFYKNALKTERDYRKFLKNI